MRGLPRTGVTASINAGDDGNLQRGWPDVANRFVYITPAGQIASNVLIDRHEGKMWITNSKLIVPGTSLTIEPTTLQLWNSNANYYITDFTMLPSPHNFNSVPIVATSWDGEAWHGPFYAMKQENGPGSDAGRVQPGVTSGWQNYWVVTPWVRDGYATLDEARVDFATALANIHNLTYYGFADWRMPNVYELGMIVNEAAASPATYSCFGNAFGNALGYWTGTPKKGLETSKWAIKLMGDGSETPIDRLTATLSVAIVRDL